MPFTGDHPVTFSQGRRNEVYVYQGYGRRGEVYRPSRDAWRLAGLDAPKTKPIVNKSTDPVTYYISKIEIEESGQGYNRPPKVSFSGGNAVTGAEAIAEISNGSVSSITLTNYGKGYTKAPCVKLSKSDGDSGSGAEIEFEVEGTMAEGDPATGIVYWEITRKSNGLAPCLKLLSGAEQELLPGSFVRYWYSESSDGKGARVRLNLAGRYFSKFPGAPNPDEFCDYDGEESVPAVEVEAFGSGYQKNESVVIEVPYTTVIKNGSPFCGPFGNLASCPLIVTGYPLGHPKCPDFEALARLNPSRSVTIRQFKVKNKGKDYYRSQDIKVATPNTGDSAATYLSVRPGCNGEIEEVIDSNLELLGKKVLFPPDNTGVGGIDARAIAVTRPTLRGKYQCYYRFVNDSVPEEEGGPLYSSLSPVTEVDCGDGCAELLWGYAGGAGTAVELWRTTSNQATTLYRVAKLGGKDPFGSAQDSLSDFELTDPDRQGFEAMPILLSNGELNANRFGVPPTNFAVGVMFQDRMWMGVDTSGDQPNTLRFSEADEPESMPDVNELIIQSNLRSTDYVTALIPYAGAMIVCQTRHSHRLTYVAQPLIDASFFLLAYRGCVNQRCWDLYDGRVYAMDDQGVYSLDPQGNVESLTLGIDNLWQGVIDFSKREWFLVRADRRLNVLRVNLSFKGDGPSKYPTRQLVYSFEYKSWWEERYPEQLTAASECRTTDGQVALVYGTGNGQARQISSGLTDLAWKSIILAQVTNPGRGYRIPPKITAVGGGHGAEFEAGINSDGQVTGIMIKHPGTGYTNPGLVIEPPPEGGVQAEAVCTGHSGRIPVFWSWKSGCFEYENDSVDPKAANLQTRHCSVTYRPTKDHNWLRLQAYYNNAAYPRSNVARRDRGTGFIHSDEIPAAELDMKASPLQEAESHGVARALFAGRVLDDMMGTDRHVSIALSGHQNDSGPVEIHKLDIFGVNPPE